MFTPCKGFPELQSEVSRWGAIYNLARGPTRAQLDVATAWGKKGVTWGKKGVRTCSVENVRRTPSFPGSAWERTTRKALPCGENSTCSGARGRVSNTRRSQAEPGNEGFLQSMSGPFFDKRV